MARKHGIWEGKVIKKIRFLGRAELAREGWDQRAKVAAFELTDGSLLYASCDPEGNGPGALFGVSSDGDTVWISPSGEG